MTTLPLLPDGATCSDCWHFTVKCSWLLSRHGSETTCDWAPSLFRPDTPEHRRAVALARVETERVKRHRAAMQAYLVRG